MLGCRKYTNFVVSDKSFTSKYDTLATEFWVSDKRPKLKQNLKILEYASDSVSEIDWWNRPWKNSLQSSLEKDIEALISLIWFPQK